MNRKYFFKLNQKMGENLYTVASDFKKNSIFFHLVSNKNKITIHNLSKKSRKRENEIFLRFCLTLLKNYETAFWHSNCYSAKPHKIVGK
jgi:hypothetical protein